MKRLGLVLLVILLMTLNVFARNFEFYNLILDEATLFFKVGSLNDLLNGVNKVMRAFGMSFTKEQLLSYVNDNELNTLLKNIDWDRELAIVFYGDISDIKDSIELIIPMSKERLFSSGFYRRTKSSTLFAYKNGYTIMMPRTLKAKIWFNKICNNKGYFNKRLPKGNIVVYANTKWFSQYSSLLQKAIPDIDRKGDLGELIRVYTYFYNVFISQNNYVSFAIRFDNDAVSFASLTELNKNRIGYKVSAAGLRADPVLATLPIFSGDNIYNYVAKIMPDDENLKNLILSRLSYHLKKVDIKNTLLKDLIESLFKKWVDMNDVAMSVYPAESDGIGIVVAYKYNQDNFLDNLEKDVNDLNKRLEGILDKGLNIKLSLNREGRVKGIEKASVKMNISTWGNTNTLAPLYNFIGDFTTYFSYMQDKGLVISVFGKDAKKVMESSVANILAGKKSNLLQGISNARYAAIFKPFRLLKAFEKLFENIKLVKAVEFIKGLVLLDDGIVIIGDNVFDGVSYEEMRVSYNDVFTIMKDISSIFMKKK